MSKPTKKPTRTELVAEYDSYPKYPGRFDIAPVLALGGWGVHMPYRTTWAHETDVSITSGLERMCEVAAPEALPAAVLELATRAIAL